MKKIILLMLFVFAAANIYAQTATNGGIRIRVVVTQLQEGTNGSDFLDEEMDWQIQPFFEGGTPGTQACYGVDDDAGGMNTQYAVNNLVHDQYFTCAMEVPANVRIEWRAEEDDVDARCSHSGSDDSKTCLQIEAPIVLSLPPDGTPMQIPFSYTNASDCDNFDAQGEWGIAGYIEVTQLPEAWDLGPAQIRCVPCVAGGPTGGPGSCFYVDVPYTKSSSTIDNTLTIATNGGPANSGDDPNAGAVGVLTTGTMSFGPYTFNGNYDLDFSYPSGDPGNPTCVREFKQNNVVVCINCPDLATVHVDSDECLGQSVILTATIDDPVTYLEGRDYFIQWQLNGVDIPGASTWGPNGIDDLPEGLGGGDDASKLTYNHTVVWGTDPGACSFEDQVYTAQLYCLTDGTTECGTAAKTSTDLVGACGPYYNYTQGLTCYTVDLSYLPPCAIAKDFTYEVHVASGAPYGLSWICEAVAEVHTPVSNAGPFCHPGITGDPASAAQCALYPGDGEQSGTLNEETCSGGPGNGTGASNLGPNLVDLGGQLSTTPASGLWQVCIYDVFNDNAAGIEGVVNYVNLDVNYYLPPGCSINPLTDSAADAINQSATALATAPLTTIDHPEGAGELTGVRVCDAPQIGTDYVLPVTCSNVITDVCGGLSIRYSLTNPGAGDGDGDIADEYPLAEADLPAANNGDIIYFAVIVDANGDNISDCPACADFRSNFTVAGCCPQILTATADADECIGGTITLTATVTSGTTEGQDYWIEWLLNGQPIGTAGSATFGADGIYGNADDPATALTYVHTVTWGTDPGACGVEDQVYTARLYCLSEALLELGDPAKTTTDAAGSAGNYYNYTQPLSVLPINLTSFPACAIATDFNYEVHLASGPPYGLSWICEAVTQVSSPIGTEGPFCHPSIAPDDECRTWAVANANGTNVGTCFGEAGNGVGSFNVGPSNQSLGGVNSTTPASGIWQVGVFDTYNDNGASIEGVINYVYLKVNYMLPPGCAINPITGSEVVAINLDATPLATAPLSGATNPNGAGLLTGVRVCEMPTLDIDYEIAPDCAIAVTDLCGELSIGYAASAAGPFDHTLTDAATLVSNPPVNGDVWYYEIFVDANGDNVSDCPDCATVTGSHTIVQPDAPTPVGNNSICEGATSVPTAQQLTATCADCPAPPAGAPITVTKTYSGPTVTIDAQTNAPAGSVTFTTADFPTGYVIQDVNITVTWQKTDGSCAVPNTGTPYYNEMGLGITTPASSFDLFTPGFYTSSGSGPTSAITWTFDQEAASTAPNTLPPADGVTYQPATGTLASLNGTAALGTYSMNGTDLTNADPLCISSWSVTVMAVPPVAPPTPAEITWYDAATGGTLQGTGSPFDPMGKISAQGPVDLNTPGNYTFYAQCGCGGCVGARTPVIFTVVPKADGPSVDDVELCIGGTVPTITPIGSVIGSVFNIYALGGITPLNAAPQTQFTSADLVSYGFNPAVATSTTYLVTEIVTQGALSCESAPTPFTITVNPAPVPTASNSGPYCEGETIEVSATGGAFYAWSGPGGYSAAGSPGFRFDADPTMAGTYTVTVTNLQSCTAEASTDVVIKTTPIAPTATGSAICLGETVTAADFLAATAPTCPGIAGTSTTPGATGTTSVSANGLPQGIDGGGIPPAQTNILSFPAPTIPAGAFVTSISMTITTQDFLGNGDDIRVFADGVEVFYEGCGFPSTTSTITVTFPISYTVNLDPCGIPIGSSYVAPPVIGLGDCANDVAGFDSQITVASLTYNYQLPPSGTCAPAIPGGPANITWWNSPVGGTQQGTGLTLDPTGKIALQGAFDNNTPGVYTFFAESECASCTSDRTPVSIRVNEPPFALAFNDGPICLGGTATLTAARGTTYAWDNGAGTGSPVSVSPATTTTYTVTVTDGNGCTATAATTVVVNPNPTAAIAAATYTVCEGGSVVIDGSATSGTAPYTYVWGGTGAPYLQNANLSDPIFDAELAALGTYTLTLQIIDANGCSSTLATSSVEVVGGGTPVISCPSNITISAQTGLCNAFLVAPAPTYNNGCYGDLNLTYTLTGVTTGSGSDIPATTFNLGTTTVTYTVTDANVSTATASCSFTVTIEDNEPPIISCPADITVSAASNACTALVTVPLPPVVTDNCTAAPAVTYALSGATTGSGAGAATGTYNAGVTIVTYTATDVAGNSAVCEMTVTVVENILPTITCPANLVRTVVADATTNCTYTATTAEVSPVIGDNCTAVTVAANVSYTAFGATSAIGTGAATLDYNVGTTFVTYTVTDASGNTRQCSFSVVVTDTTVPTITCPANVIGTTDLNTCNSLETIALPSNVADNCAVASYTNSYNNTPNASGVYPLGTTNVTYTVTDIYSNTATCAFSVTISDAQAPSIICPTSLTAYTGAGATTCSAVVTTLNTALSFDNCTAVPTLSYVLTGATTGSGTGGNANGTYNVGTTTVTFTATDNASNTATCAITVLVIDNTPPAIVCAADIAVPNLAGSCYATPNVPRPTALDNCTAAASLVHNYVLSGATTGSGSAIGAGGITGVNFNVGVTTVTWTVLDAVGNSSTCSHTVTVNDTQAPTLTCPAAVTVNAASCSAFATVAPLGIADNCGGNTATVSFSIYNTNALGNNNTLVRSGLGTDASGIFPIGVSTIMFNVSDTYGNTASCSSTVTVNDIIAPTIVCPANDFIVTTSSTDGSATACATQVNIVPVTAYDNCNQIGFSYQAIHTGTSSDNNGVQTDITATLTGAGSGNNASGVYPVGVTVITYTATDAYGNTSSCIIRVQVDDDELPLITLCPPIVQVTNTLGLCANTNVTVATLTATDNCGIASITNNHNSGGANASGTYPVGATTVVYTVTDVNGNTATCSTLVVVGDTEPPVAVCQPLILDINNTNEITVAPIQVFSPNSSDNCGTVTATSVSPNTFSCPANNGVNTVTLTVTDASGNTATCSTTVTINCCNAEAGTVAVGTICPSQSIPMSAQGFSVSSGTNTYVHYYLIANPATNVIVANGVIAAGTSTSVPYANLTPNTNYVVYGYVVKTNTTPAPTAPTVGFDIDNIATLATCWDITGAVSFYVPAVPPVFMGYSSISQGVEGGISPFAYTTEVLTLYGGTLPYQFNWVNTGYVRYDIVYQNIDHDNNPATPSLPGAVITVIYADSATWAVTATDVNSCSTSTLSFDNTPGGTNANALLDIDSYTIIPQTNTLPPNGGIDITVTGGNCDGAYTYQWSGPNGFTATTTTGHIGSPNLPGLAYGWYAVTVTCGNEYTEGWYWVPRQRRGRTKVDGTESLISIAPNPFNHESTIEFYSEKGGHIVVRVYAMDGREVAVLYDDETEADMTYSTSFNGSNLPSGAYNVVLIDSEGNRLVERAILTK